MIDWKVNGVIAVIVFASQLIIALALGGYLFPFAVLTALVWTVLGFVMVILMDVVRWAIYGEAVSARKS